jgi:hypothetical protein
MTTKEKGNRAEGAVMAALIKAGKQVLLPIGENQRYDLVVEEAGKFIRIQCKAGRLNRDQSVIIFRACSIHSHRGYGTKDYRGEADVFGVYVPDLNKVYLVPVEDVAKTCGNLRLVPSKNNQIKGTLLAEAYELL